MTIHRNETLHRFTVYKLAIILLLQTWPQLLPLAVAMASALASAVMRPCPLLAF